MWIGTAALSFVAATPLLLGAQQAPRIPLSAGLTLVSAFEGPRGDYESFKRIERIDDEGVHLAYSTERNKRPVRRTVRPVDLASSRHYLLRFAENYPEVIQGTTGIGTSKLVLTELKSRGHATFAC